MLRDLKRSRIPQAVLCGLLAVPVLAGPAQAHVKWFAPYDMEKPPLPIGEVPVSYTHLTLPTIYSV